MFAVVKSGGDERGGREKGDCASFCVIVIVICP